MGKEAWRSVGNRKERYLGRDDASSPVQSKDASSLRAYSLFLFESSITLQEFRWLMEGLSITQRKAFIVGKPGTVC